MRPQNLAGMRALGFTRRSTDQQSDASNDQQGELLLSYAHRHQMVWVGVEHSKAVSASVTNNRSDIESLLERAETQKDFDVLLIQSYDRLTRGGGRHGPYLLHRFAMAGVKVISITNDIPDGDWAPLMEVVEFIKGNAYVKSLAFNTTRGSLAALLEGRTAYCRRTPFAIDRLLLSSTGDKLFRIRNLRDGSQVKLRWDNDEVLEKYPANVKNEGFKHFIKRKEERIVLINGAEADVEIVRMIFNMHYVQGIGARRIAMHLNEKEIPTATGQKLWNQCSVFCLLRNPIYIQRGIANQRAQGKFNNRASTAGASPLTARTHAERFRPTEEWIVRRHNEITIVPPELHDSIWERQYKKLLRRIEQDDENKKKMVDRPLCRANSHWPLLGAIVDQASGAKLASHRCGPKMMHRYYVVQTDRTNPQIKKRWKRKFFPAAPVEKAVLEVLAEVLGDVEALRPMVLAFARDRLKSVSTDVKELEDLQAQRRKLVQKKAYALDEFDDLGPDLLRQKVAPLTAQIASLNARISEAERQTEVGADPTDIADAVVRQLENVTSLLGEPSTSTLRSVINALTRTVVNFEGREAEIEIRLPEAAFATTTSLKGMCAMMDSAHKDRHRTQPDSAVILGKFHCERRTEKRHPCLVCQRKAA